MKKISKFLFSLIALSLLVLPTMVSATVNALDASSTGLTAVDNSISLTSKDPIKIATSLINTAMVFLGLIAVVIILAGGFKWMTAMGDTEAIKKAKGLMTAGIVGMVIILAAWGISKYVLVALISATNGI